jgi:hypothetical protein
MHSLNVKYEFGNQTFQFLVAYLGWRIIFERCELKLQGIVKFFFALF